MIRPMRPEDAVRAAEQHAVLMEHSVFAMFGAGFLACFYRHFATAPNGIAFAYGEETGPQAYIVSTSDRPAFLRGLLLRYGPRLAWHALRGLLRPACRRLAWQTFRYLRRTGAARTPAEMIFITVPPECRNHGVARALIGATIDQFRRRQVRLVSVTVESDNAPVRALLEKLGFRQADRFAFAGKENDLFLLDLGA